MGRHPKSVGFTWMFLSLATGLILLTMISSAEISLAHPPHQEGVQPGFSVIIQTAPDDRSRIESQETELDHHYFETNGSRVGVAAGSAGLALAAGETSGSYVSDVINSPLSFTTDIVPLWQAQLPEGTELTLETRLRLAGQAWSAWLENPEAFYPVRDSMHGGHLIWVGSEQVAFQFRVTLHTAVTGVSPVLNSINLVFNDTSEGPTDGAIARQITDRVDSAETVKICLAHEKPPVVSRTAWGCPDGQESPRRPPVYRPVTHVILHQTETPNDTHPYQDWAGWVRSVWNYHARVLWWGDVGYNYLIDPNGTIYEGRAGGDDVIGIHDRINAGSMGIGFLGCYGACDDPRLSVTEPSDGMLDSAAHLIAWKLSENGLDPHSSGPYGPLPDVPVIAGGRDVVPTSSPGDNLYDQLPRLRDLVAEKIAQCHASPLPQCQIPDVTFDQAEYSVGQAINLTATVVDNEGNPLSGASVTASVEQPDGNEGAVDLTGDGPYQGSFTNTDQAGEYRFSVRATDPTGERFAACVSEEQVVTVTGDLQACSIVPQAQPAVLQRPGETVTLSASVSLNEVPITDATVTAQVTKPDELGMANLNLLPEGDGTYASPFDETPIPGTYNFSVTATGQDFAECQAESSFSVEPLSGTTVFLQPETLSLCQGDATATSQIRVTQVSNLQGIAFSLEFDPEIVTAVDADPSTPEVTEIRLGETISDNLLFTARNEVEDGVVDVAVVLDTAINGEIVLAEIDWQPVGLGNSPLTLSEVDLADPDGGVIDSQLFDGSVEVTSCNDVGIMGRVLLQGREDHTGVTLSDGRSQQAQTQADGTFTIASSDIETITVKLPGYLSAQVDLQSHLQQTSNTEPVDLGTITLLAGDVNNDDVIDLLDLVYLAARYRTSDATADINADGVVNIHDLALVGGNYRQQGPLTRWQ